MKTFYLGALKDLPRYEQLIRDTMPDELFVLEVGCRLKDMEATGVFSQLAKATTRGCVVLPDEPGRFDLPQNPLLPFLEQAGIQDVCVKMKLVPGPAQLGPFEALHHKHPRERSETAVRFEHLRSVLQGRFNLFPNLVLESGTLDLLYPTLLVIADTGVPWVHLTPTQLEYESAAPKIKNTFKMLRMVQRANLQIHFSPLLDTRRIWNAKTDNLFSGPLKIDFDVSNTCTHNCTFCTFYSDEGMKAHRDQNGGKMNPERIKLLSAKLDRDRGLKLLRSLPDTVEFIQFGGIGDPYTHPDIDEFIATARRRGFSVSVLSNFSYMNEGRLKKLHQLGSPSGWDLHYVVNLSAANAETYQRVRPNQTAETFKKVLRSIQYARKMADEDGGRGIGFTLLLVLNRFNFRDMADFVSLGKELEVNQIWIKPLEIHSDIHKSQLPQGDELKEYKKLMKQTLKSADTLKVKVHNRHMMEALLDQQGSQ